MQMTLIMINVPTDVVGGLQGNIFDLRRIPVLAGLFLMNCFLFLGDFVKRGQYSVEVITLLFALVSKFPEHVAMQPRVCEGERGLRLQG
jgi:protein phosphatase